MEFIVPGQFWGVRAKQKAPAIRHRAERVDEVRSTRYLMIARAAICLVWHIAALALSAAA